MNVIQFPKPSFVEITGGVVRFSTITGAAGTHPVPSDIGRFHFYVDVVEADGGRIGMWSGTDHAEAVKQAGLLALDFNAEVRDLTGGAQ